MTSITDYVKDVLRYSIFSNPDQNNEYDVELTEQGLIFIPIYPITFVVDEKLYSKIFNLLSVALTPQYTLIRPLTMQIVTFQGNITRARGLLFPLRKGKANRIVGNFDDLKQGYYQTGNVPIMQNYDWNYVKSPDALITGVSGSGKSYFLKILYQMCNEIGEVQAIDPKGSDLARLAKKYHNENVIVPSFLVEADEHGMSSQFLQEVIKKLKELEKLMYQRQRRLYEESTSISTDYRELGMKPYFIFIDELAALMTNANKRISDDFKNVLTRLIILGRESGIYLVLAMQSARAEYLPTIVRDSISLRVQLGRINSENTRFLFPELTDMPMIPLGGKGTGIISIAGDDRYAGIEPLATPTIIDE